jgi:hypothetical protein
VSQTLDTTRFVFPLAKQRFEKMFLCFVSLKSRFVLLILYFVFSLFYFGDCLSAIGFRQTQFCFCQLPVANRQGKEKRAFELELSNARFVLDLLSAVCRYVFSNLIRTRTRRTDS